VEVLIDKMVSLFTLNFDKLSNFREKQLKFDRSKIALNANSVSSGQKGRNPGGIKGQEKCQL